MRSQDWKQIGWENHSWKYLSSIGDERIIIFQRTKVYVFSYSVLCLRKILQNPESNEAWEQRLGWIKSSQNYRNFDRIHGAPMEFEWNIFPGFDTLQLSEEVKSLLYRLGETVNTINPHTAIHEQTTITNGYEKVCTTTSTLPTTVRPLWTTT